MTVIAAVATACERIAPLWPLTNFVAVNPLLGMTDLSFVEAASLLEHVAHARLLPGHPSSRRVLSVADLVEANRPHALNGQTFVVDEISKWCSSYFDQGQAIWPMPWRDRRLFAAWKAASALDANPELMGLRGFRKHVAALSDDPIVVIDRGLAALKVPAGVWDVYLLRLLFGMAGWSGYVQQRVRDQHMRGNISDELAQLLAIRITYDVVLLASLPALAPRWREAVAGIVPAAMTAGAAMAASHDALLRTEHAYHAATAHSIVPPTAPGTARERPTLQAVFCIDVRSEVFRRALEAQSPAIQTVGFAGFFGVPLEYRTATGASSSARCPVLLLPSVSVDEPLGPQGTFQWLDDAWQGFRTSALSCFSWVEVAGLSFSAQLAAHAFGAAQKTQQPAGAIGQPLPLDLPIDHRVALAANMLRNMGLTSTFAKTILICGHGAATANNPYNSSLDCGACGGHAGDINARAATTLLNDPWVRFGLTAARIVIPEDTRFVSGLHNTTTDDVAVEGVDADIAGWLRAASQVARSIRRDALGLSALNGSDLGAAVRARSRDWSEVRPEWGLAGNAAFIAAPRSRTRGRDLGGRAFLHDYDASTDTDGAVLEQIMTAPMVVASWINLQYYASTVDNARFGSGNKLIHNVVGTFGVWQGNSGDLQVGLPWQSVHDGASLRHEPLRLSVFVEAKREAIEAVLHQHEHVRQMVVNQWLHLIAIEPGGSACWRFEAGQWVTIGRLPAREAAINQLSSRR